MHELKGTERTPPPSTAPANPLGETEVSKGQVGSQVSGEQAPGPAQLWGHACSGLVPSLQPQARVLIPTPSGGYLRSREVTGSCEGWGQGTHKTAGSLGSLCCALWPSSRKPYLRGQRPALPSVWSFGAGSLVFVIPLPPNGDFLESTLHPRKCHRGQFAHGAELKRETRVWGQGDLASARP